MGILQVLKLKFGMFRISEILNFHPCVMRYAWVNVFRIIPDFMTLMRLAIDYNSFSAFISVNLKKIDILEIWNIL